jgi:hypothetical protein
MRRKCKTIEDRISHITDSKRTSVDLWRLINGPFATRETRMEAIAWIAVCVFSCRIEGGFVRDWVVGGYRARPSGAADLVKYEHIKGQSIPVMNKEVIPCDLDCHLPVHLYFDINKFEDKLHEYHFEYELTREEWRYVLLLDKDTKTGPFTMDLVEPHVSLTHDRIDFDVSNLFLEKDYTRDLGMRVDISQLPYDISLETIVARITEKRFQLLRPKGTSVKKRIAKMNSRGWKQIGPELNVVPDPPAKYFVVLTPLPEDTSLHVKLLEKLQKKIQGFHLVAIEEIKNTALEDLYVDLKTIIEDECRGDPNEMELFHGTRGESVESILNHGYDDRYYARDGAWGELTLVLVCRSMLFGKVTSNFSHRSRCLFHRYARQSPWIH